MGINLFTPEFLTWTLPALNLGRNILLIRILVKIHKRVANTVDPDEMAQKYMIGSSGLKGLKQQ